MSLPLDARVLAVTGVKAGEPSLHATWKIGGFDRDIAPCCYSVVIAKSVPCPPIGIVGVCSDRFFQR